ncbi:MAG: hypothetical protein AAFP07_22640 [Cyanobacteria bacterium J06606_4]
MSLISVSVPRVGIRVWREEIGTVLDNKPEEFQSRESGLGFGESGLYSPYFIAIPQTILAKVAK